MLGLTALARAHDDPAGCASTGIALTMGLFRVDGTTPLSGSASECERVAYRVTMRKARPSACAFSNGTLTLTTADGVAHRLEEEVPLIGGTAPTKAMLESALVPYAVRPGDVVNDAIKAVARYAGGVAHDTAADTPGVSALVDRTVPIVWCGDADPCTYDRCDPMKAGVAGCFHPPLCDDDDPLTADTCTGGRCTFDPIASVDRTFCAGRPFRGHHALADKGGRSHSVD